MEINRDLNPLHVNEEYAKTTIFGTRIASGLATSLLRRFSELLSWEP
ncbi:MaoC-like protein [Leptospira weilii serovar Topaz str. LT2116]|uniref:MaoC-like protein n=1 Tax=Leptospira weilii serovar Topaz str. LT2116 TaxID=1088540 RepID=M3FH22_9LEPT|nr:MaoC-like protein [Leptospira weilii serovar Topaz str. LT2116]